MSMEEDASGDYKRLNNSSSKLARNFSRFCSAAREVSQSMIEAKQQLMENKQAAIEFANQLAQIDFNHASFGYQWESKIKHMQLRITEMDFKTEEMDLRGQQLGIQGQQVALQVEQAKIGMMQAVFAVHQAAFAMQQAMVNIEQALVGMIQARFSLEAAGIAAGRANLDYEKKVKDLDKEFLEIRQTAIQAEKKWVEDVSKVYEPFVKLSDAASKYVKTLGGTRELMERLKKETLDYTIQNNLEGKYNVSAEELLKLQMKYNQELGRNIILTGDQVAALGAMHAVFQDEKAIKIATALDSFGYGFDRSADLASKLFSKASKYGIALEKSANYFLENIKLAQTYAFENGVKGLEEMAEQAAAINFDMKQTARVSDKLSTVEGVMAASAHLTVAGGQFAMISNPLKLLSDSLNDMTSLQDDLVKSFGSMAFFDDGQMTLSSFDRQQINELSGSMGIDPKSMMNSALSAGRVNHLTPQIDKLGLDEDTVKLLKNVAQIDENGKGYVNIEGNQTSLSDAAKLGPEKLAKILKSQTQSDSDNIMDVAMNLRSIKDNVEAFDKSLFDEESNFIEESGMGTSFTDQLAQQAESDAHMRDLAKQTIDIGVEKNKFTKDYTEYIAKYQEQTLDADIKSADLARRQKKFGVKAATAALHSAQLQAAMAPLQFEQARIQQASAALAGKTAKVQAQSAAQQAKVADKDKRKLEQYEKPLFELESGVDFDNKLRDALYQEAASKRVDDIWHFVRMQTINLNQNKVAVMALASKEKGGGGLDTIRHHMEAAKSAYANKNALLDKESEMKELIDAFADGSGDAMNRVLEKYLGQAEAKETSNVNETISMENGGNKFGAGGYTKEAELDGSGHGMQQIISRMRTARDADGNLRYPNLNATVALSGKKDGRLYADDSSIKMINEFVSSGGMDDEAGKKKILGTDMNTIRTGAYKQLLGELEFEDHESDMLMQSGGGAIGNGNIQSASVNQPIVGGRYDTSTIGNKSMSRKQIGGSIDLNISDDDIDVNTNSFVYSMMNNPHLMSKFSEYVSQEILNNSDFGYVKNSTNVIHDYV